ncbi:MAG: ribosome maturation factor RimM [Neisseriaceae bacterium]|nr:MAG: ribosome maturation factor RimM [Neisseriaceae bacterium]
MSRPANLIDMGYIANAFGIQGWVKIKTATEYSDSLDEYAQVYLKLKDGTILSKKIEKSFARDGVFHAKLAGINDRDAAFALKGIIIAVDREEFPDLDDDEFYWVDLIGLNVINVQGESLGIVKDLMETGANDVLVVKLEQEERLIPFVAQYVVKVDMQNKQIIVDWGLDY